MTNEINTGLNKLREPFLEHQISKLPKPTRKQTDEVKADFKKGIRCEICGGWHHPNVIHLDYVGHAALTDRLLDVDPEWNWKPFSVDAGGSPVFDNNGGMWIELTVCGVTRLGYGCADGKTGGDAIKEVIGDALRNAAMRFGAALDLWHKGDLHIDDEPENPVSKALSKGTMNKVDKEDKDLLVHKMTPKEMRKETDRILQEMLGANNLKELQKVWGDNSAIVKSLDEPFRNELMDAKDFYKDELNDK